MLHVKQMCKNHPEREATRGEFCQSCYDRERYLNSPKKERQYAKRQAQKQGKDNKYHCGKCYNATFRLEPRNVRGAWGIIQSDALVCTSCNEVYHIEPCSTTGLTRELPPKE